MSIFDSIKSWFSPRRVSRRDITHLPWVTSEPSLSGLNISETQALSISTVWRGARVISEAIGGMPLKLYTTGEDNSREEADEHPLYELIHDEPNPEDTALEFWSQLVWWAVLWGNGYAEIARDGTGATRELWAIPPWRVQVLYDPDWTMYYQVDGVRFERSEMIHLKGPSEFGGAGYRLVHLARETFALALACDKFGSAYFGNSTQLGGVLETAAQLSEEARANLRKSWKAAYQGVDKAGSVALLEEGLSYKPFEASNEQGQYNETRTAQVYEICRWIGIDPIFVFEYGRATWSNGELQYRNFLKFSLDGWLKKIEAEVRKKCLTKEEKKTLYPEFCRHSFLELDQLTQAQVWAIGVDKGWYDPEIDIRPMLNLPALPPKPEPVPPVVMPVPGQLPDTPPVDPLANKPEDSTNA